MALFTKKIFKFKKLFVIMIFVKKRKKEFIMTESRKKSFAYGMRDGVPIGLGYLAVSFSLGIMAANCGLSAFQSVIASLLCNASAGEYIGFTLISAGASYVEVAIMTFIANARYILMSCAMSQRMSPDTKPIHRFLMSFDLTDEVFGITIARRGFLNPYYMYGAMVTSIPLWALGTGLGNVAGNVMPERIVSALSVALYGMFIAIIVPPAKKDKVIAGLIVCCFALSYIAANSPYIRDVSDGTRTILLTVIISSIFALCFPHKADEWEE